MQKQESRWAFSMKKCILNSGAAKRNRILAVGPNTKFIYQSQRDGYNHLYLFDADQPNMKGET